MKPPNATLHDCVHRGYREARRPGRHPARVAAQPPLEREDPLPDRPRRQRLHPVRHVEEGGRRRGVHPGRPPLAGKRGRRDGTVRADARAPGGYEIDVTDSRSSSATDYPITPKEHGVDYLMDRRHLWIRSPRQQAILRVRHEVIDAVRDYFNSAASSSPTRRSSRRRPARARPRCSRCSTSSTRPPT